MMEFEKRIIDFFKKNYLLIFAVGITLLSIFIRLFFLDYRSNDFDGFLNRWFEYFKTNGQFKALATYDGDYNAPYLTLMVLFTYLPFNPLYMIKGLSILFDFVLAFSCGYLVYDLTNGKNKRIAGLVAYSCILFLPQVILNSSMWAQCDSIYSSFVILSLIFLLKEKYPLSFILLGCAFAFKLQFIFLLPLYVILYICQNKFSIFHFLLIPLTNIVLCLPAMIFGGIPFSKCFSIFGVQINESVCLVLNYPNIYQFIHNNFPYFKLAGIGVMFTLCFSLLIYIIHKNVKWNHEKILTLSLFLLTVVTYILPGMHERYMFVGEILSVVYFLLYKKNLPLVIAINFNAFLTYSIFLNGTSTNLMQIQSLIYGVLILYFSQYTLKFLADDTKNTKDLYS